MAILISYRVKKKKKFLRWVISDCKNVLTFFLGQTIQERITRKLRQKKYMINSEYRMLKI